LEVLETVKVVSSVFGNKEQGPFIVEHIQGLLYLASKTRATSKCSAAASTGKPPSSVSKIQHRYKPLSKLPTATAYYWRGEFSINKWNGSVYSINLSSVITEICLVSTWYLKVVVNISEVYQLCEEAT